MYFDPFPVLNTKFFSKKPTSYLIIMRRWDKLCFRKLNILLPAKKPLPAKQSGNSFDDETLNTINMFLENNLNVSETARQLYVHRNTLLYRLEKLQKVTNLDIRIFDDALTLKIALMVVSYMKYLESMDY